MPPNQEPKQAAYNTFLLNNEWHARIVGLLIGALMIAIYFWMASGFINLMVALYHAYPDNWSHGAEAMIRDTVTILAALELIRVFQSYLLIGRVKLTFILDVALVVLIGELLSLWYREYVVSEVLLSVFVVTMLVLLRIVTTRYSPD